MFSHEVLSQLDTNRYKNCYSDDLSYAVITADTHFLADNYKSQT